MRKERFIISEEQYEQALKLYAERRWDEARALFVELCSTEKDNGQYIRLLRWISTCYAWLGNFEESQEYARRAYKECDDAVMAMFYEERYLYSNGNYDSGLRICLKLLQHRDRFDPGIVELSCGLNCEFLGRYDDAGLYFAEAYASLDKNIYPGDWARLLNEYAYVFYKLDRMEDSLRMFEESDAFPYQLSPSAVATSLYLRSGILRRFDRPEEALEMARRALALEDEDDYRLEVAKLLVKLGDFKAAIEVLDPISPPLSDTWSEFEYYETVATACFQLGEFGQAVGFLKEVMASGHAREVKELSIYGYKRMLAISLFEVGEKEESCQLLRELMDDPLASSEHQTEYTEYISQIVG
ncbi:MAG: hypothetical protein J7J98_04140 [candidate division Zixibacteria bacterium]|nr:hypothetical protein [candidate division Zixibacteria bacterium]